MNVKTGLIAKSCVFANKRGNLVWMNVLATGNGRPRRLTQPERSAATRQALLESTIECLAELGYDRATTSEISERAGLSRGAHLHHFRTRGALLAAAAVELAERGARDLERAVAELPDGPDRVRSALDVIWSLFNGPLFMAVLELSVHARTDPELRADLDPIDQIVGRQTLPYLRDAFGVELGDDMIVLAASSIRGLALLSVLRPGYDPSERWASVREHLIGLMEQRSAA
jgi:AcrR family transcriptional regulator